MAVFSNVGSASRGVHATSISANPPGGTSCVGKIADRAFALGRPLGDHQRSLALVLDAKACASLSRRSPCGRTRTSARQPRPWETAAYRRPAGRGSTAGPTALLAAASAVSDSAARLPVRSLFHFPQPADDGIRAAAGCARTQGAYRADQIVVEMPAIAIGNAQTIRQTRMFNSSQVSDASDLRSQLARQVDVRRSSNVLSSSRGHFLVDLGSASSSISGAFRHASAARNVESFAELAQIMVTRSSGRLELGDRVLRRQRRPAGPLVRSPGRSLDRLRGAARAATDRNAELTTTRTRAARFTTPTPTPSPDGFRVLKEPAKPGKWKRSSLSSIAKSREA